VPDSAFEAQSLKDFHVGHDQRGSKIGGAHSGHNTCEPHLDIRDEVKQNLVHAVAEKLKQACEAKLFDRLVIAASPKILGALRSQLGPNVMSHVIGEIDKDFTKDNYNELVEHLRATFTSAHVV
jgi:protein required for attachment to host cells